MRKRNTVKVNGASVPKHQWEDSEQNPFKGFDERLHSMKQWADHVLKSSAPADAQSDNHNAPARLAADILEQCRLLDQAGEDQDRVLSIVFRLGELWALLGVSTTEISNRIDSGKASGQKRRENREAEIRQAAEIYWEVSESRKSD
jgi:hypothetical protein